MTTEEMITEAKALWHSKLGAESCPGDAQYRTWINSCGLPSLLCAIPITEWKRRKIALTGEPMATLGLWRYCSSVTKRNSVEVGYVRPEFTGRYDRYADYHAEDGAPEKQASFNAPAEWLQA